MFILKIINWFKCIILVNMVHKYFYEILAFISWLHSYAQFSLYSVIITYKYHYVLSWIIYFIVYIMKLIQLNSSEVKW